MSIPVYGIEVSVVKTYSDFEHPQSDTDRSVADSKRFYLATIPRKGEYIDIGNGNIGEVLKVILLPMVSSPRNEDIAARIVVGL